MAAVILITAANQTQSTNGEVMKYRKRPVVIEAQKFTPEIALHCLIHSDPGPFGIPVGGSWDSKTNTLNSAYAQIRTLEGTMKANVGDWIIKGVSGELYPCKPDIFGMTYEKSE